MEKENEIQNEENSSIVDTSITENKKVNSDEKIGDGLIEVTKNLFKDLISEPVNKMREVVDNPKEYGVIAVILAVIWMSAKGLLMLITLISSIYIGNSAGIFERVSSATVTPFFIILILTLIVTYLNKDNKRKMLDTAIVIVIAFIPRILYSLIDFMSIAGGSTTGIVLGINITLSNISILLTYFGLKFLFGYEDDNSFVKMFFKIYIIYAVCCIIFRLIGVYI